MKILEKYSVKYNCKCALSMSVYFMCFSMLVFPMERPVTKRIRMFLVTVKFCNNVL